MKVWWVTVWDDYYPEGGLFNVHDTYETREEAEATAATLRTARHPWPGGGLLHQNVEVEDVSSLLGLTTE